jgi:tetratricopeptide (TPR) repeat protein
LRPGRRAALSSILSLSLRGGEEVYKPGHDGHDGEIRGADRRVGDGAHDMKVALLAAAALSGASAAQAQDPPKDRPADRMAGMQMNGPMSMGVPLSPMPAVYAGQADKKGAPVFKGLGAHHMAITTRVARTQMFFDQGVNLMFGFNHAEAIRSFREAARLDPDCAMCWWGVAFALGPNINLPMSPDAVAPAWQALQQARRLEDKATPHERAWIEALATRYSSDPKADRHAMDEAFAQAMGRLWRDSPADLDAATFYAEAMMDTQPWDYWLQDGVTPKGHGQEVVSVLETVIRQAPEHPGALHLYIHAVEATTTPERAEHAADVLVKLMPEAGHIVHMPSHIYYRVGRYADAVRVNEDAAKIDEDYIAACKAQGFYPAAYYGHNIHFLWTSSEMQGRYGAAIGAARRLIKAVDPLSFAAQLPQGEWYAFAPVVTLVRFAKWNEVLAEPLPPKGLTLDRAVASYARGYAFANTGELAKARAELANIDPLLKSNFAKYDQAGIPAKAIIELARALLDAEIARASGDLPGAVAKYQAAWKLEQALPYTEPPWWHQPTSHYLGAVLLEAKRPADAEAVYRESLKTYRDDGWALTGLVAALDAQGKTAEAAQTRKDLADAWRYADILLTSSRA